MTSSRGDDTSSMWRRVTVATGHETSLLELRPAMEKVAGRALAYEWPPGDVRRSCADVTWLREIMNVTCATDLSEGLAPLLAADHAHAA